MKVVDEAREGSFPYKLGTAVANLALTLNETAQRQAHLLAVS